MQETTIGALWLDRLHVRILTTLPAVATLILEQARAATPVDTGTLARNYRIFEPRENTATKRISIDIGNTTPYALAVELDRPFLRPALTTGTTRDALHTAICSAIKEALSCS